MKNAIDDKVEQIHERVHHDVGRLLGAAARVQYHRDGYDKGQRQRVDQRGLILTKELGGLAPELAVRCLVLDLRQPAPEPRVDLGHVLLGHVHVV